MKIRILIVDDHPLVRDGLRVMLSLAPDIEIAGEATNGKEALDWVSTHTADVVLMDISMPVMNGIEATKRIKGIFSTLKIIILSMHNSQEYIEQVSQSGASGYVLKCAGMESLFSAIRIAFAGTGKFAVVTD